MMRKTNILLVQMFLLATMFMSAHSQTEDPKRYFPSSIGSKWAWKSNLNGSTYYDEITNDSIDVSGNKYLFFNGDAVPLYKLDTLRQVYFLSKRTNSSGQVIGLDSYLWYKLDAQTGDSFLTWNGTENVKVSSWSTTIFGVATTLKLFMWYLIPDSQPFAYRYLAKDFGPTHNIVDEGSASGDYEITGCIVNGIRFGSLTSINRTEQSIPISFDLFQNYPNPFNPSTNIFFRTEKYSSVKVLIHNALGQLVYTLFNGYLQAGYHALTWDATNNSSGVYLCTVQGNGISKTIRLTLIK